MHSLMVSEVKGRAAPFAVCSSPAGAPQPSAALPVRLRSERSTNILFPSFLGSGRRKRAPL